MSTMTYKGYTARIEFDERDDLIVGYVIGLPPSLHANLSAYAKARD